MRESDSGPRFSIGVLPSKDKPNCMMCYEVPSTDTAGVCFPHIRLMNARGVLRALERGVDREVIREALLVDRLLERGVPPGDIQEALLAEKLSA